MRLALALVAVGGCNWVYGLDETKPASTMPMLCDPLPFDAHRYFTLTASGGLIWSDARQRCQAYGFDLAVLNANDSDELVNELDGGMLPFWLGVSYDGTGWTSIDGCTPALEWAPTFPSSPQIGDCLLQTSGGMRNHSGTLAMHDTMEISALCEAPRPSPQCRAQALERNYMVIDSTRTTLVNHDDAAQMCAAFGMHLVEIDSTDELDHLLANEAAGLSAFWLGAHQTQTTFTSPTGCPQVFEWNTVLFDRDCVLWDGGMDSDYCNLPDASVICELNAAT